MTSPTTGNAGTYSGTGSATDGVTVNSYGQGQCSGVDYTVPAHGQIDVDFDLELMCVTPDDVAKLDKLVHDMLDASHQSKYTDLAKTNVSGGVSFFEFLCGGVKASYDDTKRSMESWGLSEDNQKTIVGAMMAIAQTMNNYKYKGTVYNKDYDYSVTGNMFAIVMDCSIQQGSEHNQIRFIGPDVHLQATGDDGGAITLPATGKLY